VSVNATIPCFIPYLSDVQISTSAQFVYGGNLIDCQWKPPQRWSD